MEVLPQIIRLEKWMDGKLINVADQIRLWLKADGFFLQNKYPWRHGNSIPQSTGQFSNCLFE